MTPGFSSESKRYNPLKSYTTLVCCSDRLYADFLYQRAAHAFAGSELRIVHTISEANLTLKGVIVSLLIIALDEVDGDAIDLLLPLAQSRQRRPATIVVVHGANHRLWASLDRVAVDGVFDSLSENTSQFDAALNQVKEGRFYRSPSLTRKCDHSREAERKYNLLTPTERLVFAILGDGSDDEAASRLLAMTVASVQSVRKSIHRKLTIHHKGELVRLAALYGLVRFADSGIIRNGLSVLVAEYLAASKRPMALSQVLVNEIASPKSRFGSFGAGK